MDRKSRLAVVFVLNIVGFLIEVSGGLVFGSLALLSDGGHMLFDGVAYGIALCTAILVERYRENSYIIHRLEPLSAFINGLLLFPVVGGIVGKATGLFGGPSIIEPGPTLFIAILGFVINIVSVYVLHASHMTLNEKGAFYHLLWDTAGSAVVIFGTVIAAVTGFYVIDIVASILISILIVLSATQLLRESGVVLLNRTGQNMKERLRDKLLEQKSVENICDMHVWSVCTEYNIATVRVETEADETAQLTEKVHSVLEQSGIDHATVELCRGDHSARVMSHSH